MLEKIFRNILKQSCCLKPVRLDRVCVCVVRIEAFNLHQVAIYIPWRGRGARLLRKNFRNRKNDGIFATMRRTFRAECRPRAGGGWYLFKRVDKKTTGWTRPSPPSLASACIFTLTPIETTPPVNKFVATTDFFRPVPNLPPNPLYIPHNVSLSLLSFRFILDYTVRSRKKLRVFSNNNSIFHRKKCLFYEPFRPN